jgi:hypothetical protein
MFLYVVFICFFTEFLIMKGTISLLRSGLYSSLAKYRSIMFIFHFFKNLNEINLYNSWLVSRKHASTFENELTCNFS